MMKKMKRFNNNHSGRHTTPLVMLIAVVLSLGLSGCTKDFLSVKRNKKFAVPTTLDQFHELMNNDEIIRGGPSEGILACDDVYMNDGDWSAASIVVQDLYTWGPRAMDDVNADAPDQNSWALCYTGVFYCNMVLDGLAQNSFDTSETESFNDIKGAALFYRAYSFYRIAKIFAKNYDTQTASSDPGIALRLTSDLNAPTKRASVQQTYDQIIRDFSASIDLLPVKAPYKTWPSKAAAYGALARTYLSMGNYENALKNAEACLSLDDSLMDYNVLDTTLQYPFTIFNKETVLLTTISIRSTVEYAPKTKIDSTFYRSYSDNDLRKALFFEYNSDSTVGFFGSYAGQRTLFDGIAVDEVMLIAAECNARLGNKDKALSELNELLSHRYRTGTFKPLVASDAGEALDLVLQERRKELVYRGIRWADLKRLNLDPKRAETIHRVVNGQQYDLPPSDPRYVFLIPTKVIQMTGIAQNPR